MRIRKLSEVYDQAGLGNVIKERQTNRMEYNMQADENPGVKIRMKIRSKCITVELLASVARGTLTKRM